MDLLTVFSFWWELWFLHFGEGPTTQTFRDWTIRRSTRINVAWITRRASATCTRKQLQTCYSAVCIQNGTAVLGLDWLFLEDVFFSSYIPIKTWKKPTWISRVSRAALTHSQNPGTPGPAPGTAPWASRAVLAAASCHGELPGIRDFRFWDLQIAETFQELPARWTLMDIAPGKKCIFR